MDCKSMVEYQLKGRGIQDPLVLRAMGKIPRERFVPAEFRAKAYEDHPIAIGSGQTLSQPYIAALMTQELALTGTEKVLEIGTGSGYQTAVLGEIVGEVYTVEVKEILHRRAEILLGNLGYAQIKMKLGDGNWGWPEFSPFDCIIVTAAAREVPQTLLDQLTQEDGRLIIPIGPVSSVQNLILFRKNYREIKKKSIIPVRFVPLIDGV